MRTKEKYDLIIIGAGPGGSAAALAAAKRCSVAVIERRERCGVPVQCGEYAPLLLKRLAPWESRFAAQYLEGFDGFICGEKSFSRDAPGYVLRRSLYDGALAAAAADAGVDFFQPAKAVDCTGNGVIIDVGGARRELKSSFLIGADGPRSLIRQWFGLREQPLMPAVQWSLTLASPLKRAEFYFDPRFRWGYGWLFPKGDTANVGVAARTEPGERLTSLLSAFARRLVEAGRLRPGPPLAKSGGWIPVGGPDVTMIFPRCLFVGDAGGFAHPVSGSGIVNAVLTGRLAGEAVTAALNGSAEGIAGYDRAWRRLLGRPLDRAAENRRLLQLGWTDDEERFRRLILHCWGPFS
ncbi:MAG: NAD(P)/FAD-dependent oxidoreductase [Bacillota bacterium]|jgi:digeranylgeranylglycerophospholipid reductase